MQFGEGKIRANPEVFEYSTPKIDRWFTGRCIFTLQLQHAQQWRRPPEGAGATFVTQSPNSESST
jgi:hypothetical protein